MTAPTPAEDLADLRARLARLEQDAKMQAAAIRGMHDDIGRTDSRVARLDGLMQALHDNDRDHLRAIRELDAKVDARLDALQAEMRGGLGAITDLLTRLIGDEEGGTGGTA